MSSMRLLFPFAILFYSRAQRREPPRNETAVRLDNERRAQREKQVEMGTVPLPELLLDKQQKEQ